ncbi:hypothetical protein D9615_003168 [Tricholomella constricta]|uniref:Uncharacterized protein n=1 Tax=Tricholomella constricta TaxID=117010 RepID=A0A8H5HIW2_9AGAR|nr:hypothetical protein D9615_003168 [Tricholomella constricta]
MLNKLLNVPRAANKEHKRQIVQLLNETPVLSEYAYAPTCFQATQFSLVADQDDPFAPPDYPQAIRDGAVDVESAAIVASLGG